IKFLQESAAKSFINTEWFQAKLEILARQVQEFKALVDEKNCEAIIAKLEAIPGRGEQNALGDGHREAYQFLEDDILRPSDPFGNVFSAKSWFQYWDTIHRYPLQMANAQLYPWKERIMYFFLGGDVRKYFKDNMRWLNAGIENFFHSLSEMYYSR